MTPVPAERRRFDWLWGILIIALWLAVFLDEMVIHKWERHTVLVAGLWCVMGPLFVVNEVLKRRDGHTRWYLEAPAGVCMFLAGVVAFVSMLPSSDVSANVPRYLMAGWFLCAAVGIASWVRVVFRLRAARRSSASPSSPPRS